MAQQPPSPDGTGAVWAVIVVNAVWVLTSAALLVSQEVSPNWLGGARRRAAGHRGRRDRRTARYRRPAPKRGRARLRPGARTSLGSSLGDACAEDLHAVEVLRFAAVLLLPFK